MLSIYNRKTWTMNPGKISNEDYVVDSDEIMEDATQETNTQNDKDEQEIEMDNIFFVPV